MAFRHFDTCRKIVGNKYSYRRFNTLKSEIFQGGWLFWKL